MKGFGTGLIWGGLFGVAGLVIVSEVSPMPGEAARGAVVEEAMQAPAALPATEPSVAPEEPIATPPAAEPEEANADAPAEGNASAPAQENDAVPPEAEPVPSAAEITAPAGSEFLRPAPDSEPTAPASASDIATGTAPVVQAPAEAPAAPTASPEAAAAPRLDLAVPASPVVPDTPAEAPVIAALDDNRIGGGQAADAPPPPSAEVTPPPAELPPPPPLTPEEEALVETAPEILPEGDGAVLPADAPLAPDAPLPDGMGAEGEPPQAGFSGEVDGVTVGRLPRIGDAPAAEVADEAVDPNDLTPLKRYARPFENPDGKPVYAIVLVDTGEPELDRAKLAALPFPVTFALDPALPNVAELAAPYLEAGQEVVMLASSIPQGATAADLEVTFGAHAAALPQAVAVLDLPEGGFQNDRPLATQVIPIVRDQGRGLLTFDQGLNPADQVASRDGVPAATIFRRLDAEDEPAAAVRRYLDRAAFKAAQDGRVVVLGSTRPETIAALMEWSLEGRASTVALGPVSAAMTAE
jgi:polysaccharide deacetylase 2 family uncharacterized protein YibQ